MKSSLLFAAFFLTLSANSAHAGVNPDKLMVCDGTYGNAKTSGDVWEIYISDAYEAVPAVVNRKRAGKYYESVHVFHVDKHGSYWEITAWNAYGIINFSDSSIEADFIPDETLVDKTKVHYIAQCRLVTPRVP